MVVRAEVHQKSSMSSLPVLALRMVLRVPP